MTPAATRNNIAEHILSPSNVGDLQVLWIFPTKAIRYWWGWEQKPSLGGVEHSA